MTYSDIFGFAVVNMMKVNEKLSRSHIGEDKTKKRLKSYDIVGNETGEDITISVVSSNWVDTKRMRYYYPRNCRGNTLYGMLKDCVEPQKDWDSYEISKFYRRSIGKYQSHSIVARYFFCINFPMISCYR